MKTFDFGSVPNGLMPCYPRHMNLAMKYMTPVIRKHGALLLEVRDSRIPVSSANPSFGTLFPGCKRMILYNKEDLACEDTNKVSEEMSRE